MAVNAQNGPPMYEAPFFKAPNDRVRVVADFDELMSTRFTGRVNAIPAKLKGKARRRAGIDAYWAHLTGDLFVVYHELLVASRTDPELERILASSQQLFEQHVRETNQSLFSEWQDRGDRFLLAMDVTKFLMEGLAASRLMTDRTARVKRLTNYLVDRLEEIFEEGDSSAVGRHTKRS